MNPIFTSSTSTAGVWPVPPAILSDRTAAGGTGFVLLLLLLIFALWLSHLLRRTRRRLPGEGLFPAAARWSHVAVRALAALLGLQLVARLLPDAVSPALPWVLVAAAAALGWSARDLLPDLIAGLVLGLEKRVRPGDWLSAEGVEGTLVSIGLRAAVIVDARGNQLSLPNRHLISRTVRSHATPWPEVEVVLPAVTALAPRDAERIIRQAALILPWLAPGEISLVRAEDGWRLRARVLEGRFMETFSSALKSSVEEALRASERM